MGEVYRARDGSWARRGVEGLARRMARDRRSARALRTRSANARHVEPSALAQIYGFEQSGETSALVHGAGRATTCPNASATVRWRSTRRSESRGRCGCSRAAHEIGIVHRDLKPANIKVNCRRAVKVLDFGLAKAIDTAAGLQHPRCRPRSHRPQWTSRVISARRPTEPRASSRTDATSAPTSGPSASSCSRC